MISPTRLLFSDVDPDKLLPLVSVYRWVHSIDLGGGRKTPGEWGNSSPIIWKALEELNFQGAKVLDIGCWDGLYSFDAERRGASKVYLTDLISERSYRSDPTFHIAHRLLNSSSLYFDNLSVYDVPQLGIFDFDIVLFAGVYYHLRDPLRALDALRGVMQVGGQILVEGAIVEEDGCFAKYFHSEKFAGDPTNWWVPTKRCLEEWVESSGFELTHRFDQWGHLENQRHTLIARAV